MMKYTDQGIPSCGNNWTTELQQGIVLYPWKETRPIQRPEQRSAYRQRALGPDADHAEAESDLMPEYSILWERNRLYTTGTGEPFDPVGIQAVKEQGKS